MENLTVSQIDELLRKCTSLEFENFKKDFEADTRKSVQNLIKKYEKKFKDEHRKIDEYIKRCRYENALRKSNFNYIAGIDEVGRGPLAGPVYAAAVILNPEVDILDIKDSKKLSEAQRNQICGEIKKHCIDYAIGYATVEEIDRYNILNATKLAMKRAIEGLKIKPDHLLIDALTLKDVDIPQTPIIKGDDLSVSIGAASIVAKVERDIYMDVISEEYPQYLFSKNKGYGTKEHTDAIAETGICEHHRRTFVKNFIR